jgi:hypothetical protein
MADLDGFLFIWNPIENIGRTYRMLTQNCTTSGQLGLISHLNSLTNLKPTS